MNELIQKIANHYDNHRSCGLEICPMVITEYQAYQLIRDFMTRFTKPLQGYPKPGDKLECHGVTLIIISDNVESFTDD